LLKGSTPQFSAWQNVLVGATFVGHAKDIADLARVMMQDEDVYVEFLGMVAGLIPLAIDGLELPCPCEPEPVTWCKFFSLDGSSQGWTIEKGIQQSYGITTQNNGDGTFDVILHWDVQAYITSAEIHYAWNGGGIDSYAKLEGYDHLGARIWYVEHVPAQTPGNKRLWTQAMPENDTRKIMVRLHAFNWPPTGVSLACYDIEVRGISDEIPPNGEPC